MFYPWVHNLNSSQQVKRKNMDIRTIAESTMGKLFIKIWAAGMESRFRHRFFSPANILAGVDMLPGQIVLEVGCGTGYFTLPVARMIGEGGYLVATDVLPDSVELVSQKVQAAKLKNVRVVEGNALDTVFDAETFHTVLLFGVIPAPMLPLDRLLPEMHRVLQVGGNLAVWPSIPGWLPKSILQSGLFMYGSKKNGVHNFKRCQS
jgi:ubiquinone/menaquinone biosynthesis C-methylase UbiE